MLKNNICVIFFLLSFLATSFIQAQIMLETEPVSCDGSKKGKITAKVGISGNFQYALDGGAFQNSNVFDNLDEGNYTVTVKEVDAECEFSKSTTINKDTSLNVSISGGGTFQVCRRDGPPTIVLSASASGGTPPYKYSWPGGSKTVSSSGTYTVNVTDDEGCREKASVQVVVIRIRCSKDPNDMIGPLGYGIPKWVSVNDVLPYTIRFENDPDFATAPAQKVIIDHVLDTDLNLFSLKLGDFGFANQFFEVPPNSTYYTKRLDVVDSLGIYVDVVAGIDVTKKKAFWIFESIDAKTGLEPSDPLLGLLPVNDTISRAGEGFVTFTVESKQSSETGDTIFANADIIFDLNETISTPEIFNLIDAYSPSSQVERLPIVEDESILINWLGADDPGGSDIAYYELFATSNGSPYELIESEIKNNTYTFIGSGGTDYEFLVLAIDNVGNPEVKDTADVTVSLLAEIPPDCVATADTLNTTVCRGSAIYVNGNGYVAGTYTQTLTNIGGCDSILTIIVDEYITALNIDTIYVGCIGDGFEYVSPSTVVYNESNLSGFETLQDENGCNYSVSVSLTFVDCSTAILGCTDACAANYNPDATVNDDSCEEYDSSCPENTCFTSFTWDTDNCACVETIIEVTCDDENDCTIDSVNEENCECINEVIEDCEDVEGCTNTCAPNYNPNATLDDGSCESYNSTCSDNTCSSTFTWDVESCRCLETVIEYNCDDANGCTEDSMNEENCECINEVIVGCEDLEGCTDACAPNYISDATLDDGSCEAYNSTCSDDTCFSTLTWDAESCRCVETVIEHNCDDENGCTDDFLNEENCECINEAIEGCEDVEGCTDACAPNFNPDATIDDESCEAYDSTCSDDTCFSTFTWEAESCRCVETVIEHNCDDENGCTNDSVNEENCECLNEVIVGCEDVEGCTDACALNYNSNATLDDGSCESYDSTCSDNTCFSTFAWDAENCTCVETVIEYNCDDENGCTNDSVNEENCECLNEVIVGCEDVEGCTDACAPNYNPDATIDDESCEAYDSTCLEDTCFSTFIWEAESCSCAETVIEVTCDDEDDCTIDSVNEENCECINEVIEGCEDVEGCTDACASNYNPDATIDDESCETYDSTCADDTCFSTFAWEAENCACVETVIEHNCDDENGCTEDSMNEENCECINEVIEDCEDVEGCTDACAPNYNPNATIDDENCEAYDSTCEENTCFSTYIWDTENCTCAETAIELNCDDEDDCTNDFVNEDSCECVNELIEDCREIEGCMDNCAPNYNPDAMMDDGSCETYDTTCVDDCLSVSEWDSENCNCRVVMFVDIFCDDEDDCTKDNLDMETCNCVHEPIEGCEDVEGCTDTCAPNYNPDATIDDESCETYDTNCDDEDCATTGMYDFDFCECVYMNVPEIICSHNLCDGGYYEFNPETCVCDLVEAQVSGCTNPMAENYNPEANCDDESCILPPDNMIPDTIRLCTMPVTPVEICIPLMENEITYNIIDIHSHFSCSIDELDDENNACFEYTPVPNMQFYSPEQLTVTYCDDEQNCFNTVVLVDILINCNFTTENCSPMINLCTAPVTAIEVCVDCINDESFPAKITDVESMFNCSIGDLDDENTACFKYTPIPSLINYSPDMLTIEYCVTNLDCFTTTAIVEISRNCEDGLLLSNPGEIEQLPVSDNEIQTLSENANELSNNNAQNGEQLTDNQQSAITNEFEYVIPESTTIEIQVQNELSEEVKESEKFGEENKIKLYPIPAKKILRVDLPKTIYQGIVRIFSLSGQLMEIRPIKDSQPDNQTLGFDISNYENGLYYFVLRHGDHIDTKTFIKQ